MKRNAILTALAFALLAPTFACAHPQDAGTPVLGGFIHPFIGLDHLLAMIAVGVWAAQMGTRAIWAVPAAFVTAMLAGGVLGLVGIELPAVEPLVAATVLVLGLLVMMGGRVSAGYGASLATVFAIFHGAAHVADAPATANLFAYGIGLVVATVLLHLIGIFVALAAKGRAIVLRLAAAPIALAGAWLLVSRVN